jgi:hypothetical protein
VQADHVTSLALAVMLFTGSVPPHEDTATIAAIRQAYGRIERSIPLYRRIRRDLVGFSNEGGYLDAWFDGPHLRKLEATSFHETGRATEAYYFDGDTLVFVLVVDRHYDRPLSGHVVGRDEERFYFHGTQLIRWIDAARKLRDPASHDAEERSEDIQRTARLLIKCADAVRSDSAGCTAPE